MTILQGKQVVGKQADIHADHLVICARSSSCHCSRAVIENDGASADNYYAAHSDNELFLQVASMGVRDVGLAASSGW